MMKKFRFRSCCRRRKHQNHSGNNKSRSASVPPTASLDPATKFTKDNNPSALSSIPSKDTTTTAAALEPALSANAAAAPLLLGEAGGVGGGHYLGGTPLDGGDDGDDDDPAPSFSLISRLLNVVPQANTGEACLALRWAEGNLQLAISYLIDILLSKRRDHAREIGTKYFIGPALDKDATVSAFYQTPTPAATGAGPGPGPDIDYRQNWVRIPVTGRLRCLLIACCYSGSEQLAGPAHDVRRLSEFLKKIYGFQRIKTLCDDSDALTDPTILPTRENIVAQCDWLMDGTRPGDALLFYYAGHGLPQTKRHECRPLLPIDHRDSGAISATELRQLLIDRLPDGVRLIVVLDSCHSGAGLVLPFHYDRYDHSWKKLYDVQIGKDVTLYASCSHEENAADITLVSHPPPAQQKLTAGGAMSMAFVASLRKSPFGHTCASLVTSILKLMRDKRLSQTVNMSSTVPFDLDRRFSLIDIYVPKNPTPKP